MRALHLKLLRDLGGTRAMLLALVGIMAIGVAAYVATGTAYLNLNEAKHLYYSQCRMADFSIELKKAPITELERVGEMPGVIEIRPRIQFFATVDLENVVQPVNGLVLSLPDQREKVIDDIVIRQGGYFTDQRDNEVIVNEAFAREHGLYVGQWVHLLLNDRRQELFIVGTAISSEFVYLLGPGTIVPDPGHFGVFYIKRTFAEEVYDFQGAANHLVGRLDPSARDSVRAILDEAEIKLEPYGVFTTIPLADQASNRFLSNEIEGLNTFGKVMPSIFLAVAAAILNMLLTRLTEQQRTVVGTLKALGYSNLQVFVHYIQFGLLVGQVAGLVGCVGGYWLAGGMTSLYRQFFEFPRLENQVFWDTHAVGLGLSLACGFAGAFYGARNVLRLQPAEAMRPKPPPRGGAIWLERVAWLWRDMSFGWRMALRNVMRHRLRTGAGVFAAAMGSAVLVNGLMMEKSTRFLLDFQFDLVQRADLEIAFKDERSRAALDELRSLPGVDRAEPTFDVACTFVNGHRQRKGGISGLTPGARLTVPRDSSLRPIVAPRTGLTMTRKMAELLDLRRGDQVTIIPVRGLKLPRQAPVMEIADSYLGLSVYADIAYLNSLVNEEYTINGAQLAIDNQPRAKSDLFRELKDRPGVRSVTARADIIDSLENTLIKNQRGFITILVAFAGMIFFGSLLNVSLISLAERQREVATLRVLGYGPLQIGGFFFREIFLTNMTGTLLGMPLGYALSVIVAQAYDTDWFRIPIVEPGGIWLVVLALGMLFGLLAHACVQWAIYRLDWLEALKIKE